MDERPSSSRHQNATVVVIEDDAGMRRAVGRLLAAAGFQVQTFDSAEAWLEARIEGVACLVCDVRLPGLSGFSLYERLRQLGRAPPVIFITGHDEPMARRRAEQQGAVAYFTKPFPGAELVNAIKGAIDPRRKASDEDAL